MATDLQGERDRLAVGGPALGSTWRAATGMEAQTPDKKGLVEGLNSLQKESDQAFCKCTGRREEVSIGKAEHSAVRGTDV